MSHRNPNNPRTRNTCAGHSSPIKCHDQPFYLKLVSVEVRFESKIRNVRPRATRTRKDNAVTFCGDERD